MESVFQRFPGNPIDVDPERGRPFYKRLHDSADKSTLVEQFVVPPRSGRAWPVRAGQLCRLVVIEGPQVADFNAWNLHNPRERFWSARTRQLHAAHVTTYDRLWSTIPYHRPLATITADTMAYGIDADGGGAHDLLGSRCDPYSYKLMTGQDTDNTCHSNLTRAVAPYRLTELDVHDVLNIFQIVGLMRDSNRCFFKPSPAKTGDYFEFFAEIDLLCAISTCPQGDLGVPVTGPNARDSVKRCHPLGVDIYQPPAELLSGWKSPSPAGYASLHGLEPAAQ
jgi:uncharacterized protein YcgI (DUF1989 family)